MSPLSGLSNDDVKTIGAGATAVGVLLALFTPPIRHWWRSPLLSLEYDSKRNAPHWDRVNVNDEAFFLRLRVRNARGCDAAEEVQVLVAAYHGATSDSKAVRWSGRVSASATILPSPRCACRRACSPTSTCYR